MTTHAKKLLVIISEAVLERNLVHDVRAFGAHGYTISDVRGAGETNERQGSWEADRSIEIKIIADAAVAERLAQHVLATYAPHYSLTLFTSEVGVFRPQKF